MAEQKRTGMDWEDLRVFLALARHGSLSAAARILGVNHATVARRIKSLEKALGERLVDRRPDGYVLTPAGTRTLAAVSDMEAAATTLGRSGSEEGPKGLVRINAPPALTQGFLLARLAMLPKQHPGLEIEIATDMRAVSLERRETDIAVRVARPQDGDLLARHVVTMGFGFYGTSALCKAIAKGKEPSFVGFDESNAYVPEAAFLARHFATARVVFRCNSHAAQATAAAVGAGIALLPHYIGRTVEGLKPCKIEPVPQNREVWLLKRRQDRKDLPIRAVADFIAKIFIDEQALFTTD